MSKNQKKEKAPKGTDLSEVDAAAAADKLEEAMVDLVFKEPFYANLLLNMRREFTTKLPTIGVSVTDEVNLHVNPFFWTALELLQRVDILKHECHHVINNHFVRFRDLEPQIYEDASKRALAERVADMQQASVLNQAADFAINEYLPNLPREFVIFDEKGEPFRHPDVNQDGTPNPEAGKLVKAKPCLVKELKKKISSAKHKETTEYYYELLKQEQEKDKQNGQGGQPQHGMSVIDDHSLWHEGDQTEDQITDKVKEVVNKAMEQTNDRDKGSIPMEILQAIEKLNHVPKDWRNDIQRFVSRSSEILIESTRKKRNRRYGILYPGNKIYPKLHLVNIVDASGSVQDEEATQFFAEMCRLYNMEIKITVIEHDSKVNAVYNLDPKKPFKLHGRGGTSFKEAYEKAKEVDADGIIHFTDGECWDEGIPRPKVPVLWALTGGKHRKPPYNWGAKTHVEIKKKVAR